MDLATYWLSKIYGAHLLRKARITYYEKHDELLRKARRAITKSTTVHYEKHETTSLTYYKKHEMLLQKKYL